ncbi:hypothetical protein GETHLI_05230 [Geothrix limicola]|uniref:DUF3857 domain-containing protein n=1 Tax=Geothrix limicola TaxID=2927978 RepID=A0ABQ5QC57_9BACT|nr:hypothetical protein [Geothrix limicola]GLH72021.1 hypothetical protein GETHLI_05230 [Geothrix limicola]
MLKQLAIVLLMGAAGQLAAGWAPIPSDVWAIRSGPKGALVLEERMKFTGRAVEYVYRVRVFAEEGRKAAQLPDMPTTVSDIKGRTVYPDGRQVEFNDRKDFAERKVEVGGSESSATHVVPPGVTSDCVMEVSWSEPANGWFHGLPRRYDDGLYAKWTLANSVPTKLLVIEVFKYFPLAWVVEPSVIAKPETSDVSGFRVLTFHDLPALDTPPYAIKPLLGLPTLLMFYQPESLRGVVDDPLEAYWNQAAESIYKPDYESGISKGSAFKSLTDELLADLPQTPGERAGELLNRLNQNVANLSHSTYAEEAALPKTFWRGFESKDLNEAAKTRKTDSFGFRLLYYHLLKAAGFAPKIGKVVDREKALFQWAQRNPWQFHHTVIGIDLPSGAVMWFDPTRRYAAPGVIHPDYTAVNMLQVDSATWKVSRGVIPGLGTLANGRQFTYALDLSEDGDNVEAQGEFSGYPEYSERYSYLPLEPKEQGKALKKKFEAALKDMAVSEATVFNAADPKKNVSWRVKGFIEREAGRSRTVTPFPGMPWPLWVPSELDQTRKTPIVLPYMSTQVALSHFKVPHGFTPRLLADLHDENEFGKVVWALSFDPTTREVKVALRVEVRANSKGADRWESFKAYLGWIETACRRQIVLVKEG